MTMNQKTFKRRLSYDPETGVFTWCRRPLGDFKTEHYQKTWNTRFAGKVAGCETEQGYLRINFDWKRYYAHRLAWLYVYGEFPDGQIDHINGIRKDNRICNLRVAKTYSEQRQNMKLPTHNKSGYMGVSWNRERGKWRAQIGHKGSNINLGRFDDPTKAAQAYIEAKVRLHTFNPTLRQTGE